MIHERKFLSANKKLTKRYMKTLERLQLVKVMVTQLDV